MYLAQAIVLALSTLMITSVEGSRSASRSGSKSPSRSSSQSSSKSKSNAGQFNNMLGQYNQLQQQTMTENMQMQKAQAFWNPLESMSKKDATSRRRRSLAEEDDLDFLVNLLPRRGLFEDEDDLYYYYL